jgi:hypothetical protein
LTDGGCDVQVNINLSLVNFSLSDNCDDMNLVCDPELDDNSLSFNFGFSGLVKIINQSVPVKGDFNLSSLEGGFPGGDNGLDS